MSKRDKKKLAIDHLTLVEEIQLEEDLLINLYLVEVLLPAAHLEPLVLCHKVEALEVWVQLKLLLTVKQSKATMMAKITKMISFTLEH